jgi:PAXNEB protein
MKIAWRYERLGQFEEGTTAPRGGSLAEAPQNTVHRLVISGFLPPQLCPLHPSLPHHVLQFLQGTRVLLSAYPSRFVVIITLPLSLFPRSPGLVRWVELLSDGVVELTPFPHSSDQEPAPTKLTSGDPSANEETPQGLLKLHHLAIFMNTTAVRVRLEMTGCSSSAGESSQSSRTACLPLAVIRRRSRRGLPVTSRRNPMWSSECSW